MDFNVQKLLIGGAGLVTSKTVEVATELNPETITEGAGLVVQILIAIVTLFGLFKRKTPKV